MTRYLRLYLAFVRFSISRAMEFRLDFFFRIVMDVGWYAMHLAFLRVMFLHTSLFGGWSEPQMLAFMGALFLADALNMTIFASNMWWLPFFVNRGDLDYYLVRPASSLFFLSLRDFAFNSFLNVLMCLGFVAWTLSIQPEPPAAWRVALYLGLVFAGVLLHFFVELLFLIPVFWLHSGDGLRDISHQLHRYSQHPDAIYQGWVRRVLVSVLPFAVMVSFPVRALFEPAPWVPALHLLGATVVFGGLAVAAWRVGLRSYASASS